MKGNSSLDALKDVLDGNDLGFHELVEDICVLPTKVLPSNGKDTRQN